MFLMLKKGRDMRVQLNKEAQEIVKEAIEVLEKSGFQVQLDYDSDMEPYRELGTVGVSYVLSYNGKIEFIVPSKFLEIYNG